MAIQLAYKDANKITHETAYARVNVREYEKNKRVAFIVDIFPSATQTVEFINRTDRTSRVFDIVNKDIEIYDAEGNVTSTRNDFIDRKLDIAGLEEAGRTLEAGCYEYLKKNVPIYANAIDV